MSERIASTEERYPGSRAPTRQDETQALKVKTKLIHFIRHREMITDTYTEEMPPIPRTLKYYDDEGYQSIYLPEHVPAESSYLQPPPAPDYERLEFEGAGVPPAIKPYDPSLEAAIRDLEKTKPTVNRDATLEFLRRELVLREPKPDRSPAAVNDLLRTSRELREKTLQSALGDRRGVALDEESGWMDFGDLQPSSTMVLKAAAHLERGISPNQLARGPRRYSDGSTDEFIWPSEHDRVFPTFSSVDSHSEESSDLPTSPFPSTQFGMQLISLSEANRRFEASKEFLDPLTSTRLEFPPTRFATSLISLDEARQRFANGESSPPIASSSPGRRALPLLIASGSTSSLPTDCPEVHTPSIPEATLATTISEMPRSASTANSIDHRSQSSPSFLDVYSAHEEEEEDFVQPHTQSSESLMEDPAPSSMHSPSPGPTPPLPELSDVLDISADGLVQTIINNAVDTAPVDTAQEETLEEAWEAELPRRQGRRGAVDFDSHPRLVDLLITRIADSLLNNDVSGES